MKIQSFIFLFHPIFFHQNLDPELLFVRNDEGLGALEHASLTNKAPAAQYLAMLHAIFGKSVHNALNKNGDSLIHLLAEKGDDDSAEILSILLAMKVQSKNGSKPLFNVTVVNQVSISFTVLDTSIPKS